LSFRINSRSLEIINLLIVADQPLTATDIAVKLNITSRMVLTSLAGIELWLKEKHIVLQKVPGRGISLTGSSNDKDNLARIIRNYESPLPLLTSAERLQVTLLSLFITEKPILIKQLQKNLNLSRSTTIRTLDLAEKWLQNYNLDLIRRPNFGCLIAGEERLWREAFINLLIESAGDTQLLALFQGNRTIVDISYCVNLGVKKTILEVWEKLDFQQIKNILAPVEDIFIKTLCDEAYIELSIYLAVAIYRNRNQMYINSFPNKYHHPIKRYFEARQISNRVNEQFGIQLSETEIVWLAQYLPDSILFQFSKERADQGIKNDSDSSLRKITAKFISRVSLSLHPSLRVDSNFIYNLAIVFKRILDSQPRYQVQNDPLSSKVKSQYPNIFSIARQSSLFLSEQMGRELNEGEITDITICMIAAMDQYRTLDRFATKVLVVCGSGVVTASLLVARLRAEFPFVEVVEVISAFELEKRNVFPGIDYIVSTIPIKIENIPSLHVNPLLEWKDCERLKSLFEREKGITSRNIRFDLPSIKHLSDLLTPRTIKLGVSAKNWEEVVEVSGSNLLKMGAIEPFYIQTMKEIIKKHGPYAVIWPGVAILHAPPEGVRELCMELTSLREPVYFGHPENDPVKLTVVLGAVDNHSHIIALQELNQMIQNEEAMRSIQNTMHKPVVLRWVLRYSNGIKM
jgi:mannitol operon transcriptional antiterminator